MSPSKQQTHILKPLCNPKLETHDQQPRQLFPGYDQEQEFDEFDNKYKMLVIGRFRREQDRDRELSSKLSKLSHDIKKLERVASQHTSNAPQDEAEDTKSRHN